ncbi:uncharacterized protein LOC141988250 [Natator depressus]|uniref:uncharacterized protein LOC141988250 n=1 Tax=Natator depressus TaxID=27790 RepID=UPI003EB78A45
MPLLHAACNSRGCPYNYPTLYIDSSKGVSHKRDEDEEEEGEVEDRAHQASRETILPDSQELFITLEPIPSQPRLPDLEGREGTSAANVSMLRLASPYQRLAEIRRQKKRTHDEMFSELMQFTRTERAKHNVWRQTMAESRKAQNEREDRWLEQQERWRNQEEMWQQHDERRQDAMLRLLEDQTDMLRRRLRCRKGTDRHCSPCVTNRLPPQVP